jgi:hypothetical protein
MPGIGKSTFAKKRRAKRLKVCHRCARWTCNATCRSLGMVSINREDKIQFIKDDLSKGSLDNLLLTLETHLSGDVHRAIHDLWPHFHKEHDRLSDTTKRLMFSPKCRSVEVINNPARPGSNHKEVNCINYS